MTSKHQFAGKCKRVKLSDICVKGKSSLRQKDIANDGPYAVYGASGIVGSTSCFQNAKPYVAVVKDGAGVGRANACNAETSVLGTMQALIPKEGVDCRYLLHLVRSMRLGEDFSGSTIPHIYFRDYGKTLVPFPDMSGQRQIVEALDDIEKQRLTATKQIDRLDSLVKSRFVEMFGDFACYETKPLIKCVDCIEAGKSPKCLAFSRKMAEPGVLKLSAISSGVYCENENKALPRSVSLTIDKVVHANDILLSRKNTPELVGRSVLVKHTDGNIMFPDIIFRMHPLSPINAMYLSYLLAGPLLHSIQSLAHGSAKSMSNIPKSELAKLSIPIPALNLQNEFANFASQVDKSRFVAQQQIEKLQLLYDSLAQEYFGE
ncbi:restriction endonuclease subunit S [Bifidobacterium pseudocatenulatum]|uniref:restriction endonuclease subunit S n=1 Tax=Bifidobacterium pseudocatenulatum TaxID=28026 RepID=UPI001898437E|nr:restriction endonuclease subunit S [Bifidobacterium pseudocatenulatum]